MIESWSSDKPCKLLASSEIVPLDGVVRKLVLIRCGFACTVTGVGPLLLLVVKRFTVAMLTAVPMAIGIGITAVTEPPPMTLLVVVVVDAATGAITERKTVLPSVSASISMQSSSGICGRILKPSARCGFRHPRHLQSTQLFAST